MVALTAGTFLYAGCGSKNEQSLTDCLIEKNVHLYSAWWCMPCLQQEQTLEKELGEEWGYFKENIVVQCYEESKISLVQQCEDKKNRVFSRLGISEQKSELGVWCPIVGKDS